MGLGGGRLFSFSPDQNKWGCCFIRGSPNKKQVGASKNSLKPPPHNNNIRNFPFHCKAEGEGGCPNRKILELPSPGKRKNGGLIIKNSNWTLCPNKSSSWSWTPPSPRGRLLPFLPQAIKHYLNSSMPAKNQKEWMAKRQNKRMTTPTLTSTPRGARTGA